MNFYKNYYKCSHVRNMEISKIATADSQQITFKSFSSLKSLIQFYTHIFKDLKELSPFLSITITDSQCLIQVSTIRMVK